jgi:hypothetical protein
MAVTYKDEVESSTPHGRIMYTGDWTYSPTSLRSSVRQYLLAQDTVIRNEASQR